MADTDGITSYILVAGEDMVSRTHWNYGRATKFICLVGYILKRGYGVGLLDSQPISYTDNP